MSLLWALVTLLVSERKGKVLNKRPKICSPKVEQQQFFPPEFLQFCTFKQRLNPLEPFYRLIHIG